MLHRPGFAGDFAATGADVLAGLVHIGHFQGDMAVAAAQRVLTYAPVVGQLNHAVVRLVAFKRTRPAIYNIGIPDRFIAHGSQAEQLADCGLDVAGVVGQLRKLLS